jgi:hypothetical protein
MCVSDSKGKIVSKVLRISFLVFSITCLASVSLMTVAHAATPNKADAKGRRLTGEECARMERLVPETANYLGMRGDGWKLIEEGRKGVFPEAHEAMVRWVNEYNHESQLKYGYQMGGALV